MNNIAQNHDPPLCPSSRPELENSKVFGIVLGTVEAPHVNYLNQPQPVTDELVALSDSVTPAEVFRITSPCLAKGCNNFDGQNCRLATRIIENLPAVVEDLPSCSIRSDCRWWKQEGKAACIRCPQVVTDTYNPSKVIRKVAIPVTITS